MMLTNFQIYDLAIRSQVFYQDKMSQFPAKVGFYLFKNLKILKEMALEIEEMRQNILSGFEMDEIIEVAEGEEEAKVPKMLREKLQRQLDSLSNLSQEVPFYPLKLEDFEDVKLSGEQLAVLVDMIEATEE